MLIRNALDRAGKSIAGEILFKKEINVKVSFVDFCADGYDEPDCEGERLTRKAKVNSHPAVGSDGTIFRYPKVN